MVNARTGQRRYLNLVIQASVVKVRKNDLSFALLIVQENSTTKIGSGYDQRLWAGDYIFGLHKTPFGNSV